MVTMAEGVLREVDSLREADFPVVVEDLVEEVLRVDGKTVLK